MKIILTGATGFIGTEILEACIKSVYITHVYAVTRNPLSSTHLSSSKVTQLLRRDPAATSHPDTSPQDITSSFTSWSAAELSLLKSQNVTGCIWALGTSPSVSLTPESHATDLEYPLAAMQAFLAEELVPSPHEPGGNTRPFRFVYLSVSGAERDASRYLWTTPAAAAMRRLKGAAEKALFELADSEAAQGMVELYSLRLGRVLAGGQSVGNVLSEAVSTSVSVQRVAKRAIDVVLDGWGPLGAGKSTGSRVLENAEILGDDWAEINTIS